MGKRRKSAKRQVAKKGTSTAKQFKCPFCSHESSCDVKLDRKTETGRIACRVCGEEFQCRITALSDPVDVYCDWTDALEGARGGDGSGADAGGIGGNAELKEGDDDEALLGGRTVAPDNDDD